VQKIYFSPQSIRVVVVVQSLGRLLHRPVHSELIQSNKSKSNLLINY